MVIAGSFSGATVEEQRTLVPLVLHNYVYVRLMDITPTNVQGQGNRVKIYYCLSGSTTLLALTKLRYRWFLRKANRLDRVLTQLKGFDSGFAEGPFLFILVPPDG